MNLPKLGKEKEEIQLPDLESLKDSELEFKSHFGIKESLIDKADLSKEEMMYREMLSILSRKDLKGEEVNLLSLLKSSGIDSSSKLIKEIEDDSELLKGYDIFSISQVMKTFEMMERPTLLKDLGIKSIDEFYQQVNCGTIETNQYTESEIDEFLSFLIKEGRKNNV